MAVGGIVGTPFSPEDPVPRTSVLRQRVGVALMVLIFVAIVVVVVRNRESFVDTMRRVGPGGATLSLLAGVIGIGASGMQWRTVQGGLGIELRRSDALRVFFVSQLGKYLPGSVWPIVMQMEAARQRGASRKTVLAGNIVNLTIALATGLLIAAATLPFAYPQALQRYWWALAAAPLIVVLALPRSLPYLLDRVLSIVHRPPLGVALDSATVLRAAAWGALSWVGLGVHVAILAAALDGFSGALLVLCTGGMSLAVSAGVLFIPAPAGAGLREVVLAYVLSAVVTTGQALTVVVASRVILIVVDLLLAGAATVVGRQRQRTLLR